MEEKFLELIKETLEIEDRDIQLSDKFKEYPEWDSLANLTTVAMIDDEFEIVIDNEKFKNLNTLQELLDEVKRLR